MNNIFTKLLVSSTASLLVVENVNLEPLWNALITLAISIVSVLTIEGVAWLRAYIKKHTAKEEKADYKKKCEEADEIVAISDAENKKED